MAEIGDFNGTSLRIDDLESGDLCWLAGVNIEDHRCMSCAGVKSHFRGDLCLIIPSARVKTLEIRNSSGDRARQNLFTRIKANQASSQFIGAEYGVSFKDYRIKVRLRTNHELYCDSVLTDGLALHTGA